MHTLLVFLVSEGGQERHADALVSVVISAMRLLRAIDFLSISRLLMAYYLFFEKLQL